MKITKTIYLTERRPYVVIDTVYGSEMPIELVLADGDLSSSSTCTCYSKPVSSSEVYELTCSLSNNTITIEPEDGFFQPGKNQMQVEITSGDTTVYTFIVIVNCEASIIAGDPADIPKIKSYVTQAQEAATSAAASATSAAANAGQITENKERIADLRSDVYETETLAWANNSSGVPFTTGYISGDTVGEVVANASSNYYFRGAVRISDRSYPDINVGDYVTLTAPADIFCVVKQITPEKILLKTYNADHRPGPLTFTFEAGSEYSFFFGRYADKDAGDKIADVTYMAQFSMQVSRPMLRVDASAPMSWANEYCGSDGSISVSKKWVSASKDNLPYYFKGTVISIDTGYTQLGDLNIQAAMYSGPAAGSGTFKGGRVTASSGVVQYTVPFDGYCHFAVRSGLATTEGRSLTTDEIEAIKNHITVSGNTILPRQNEHNIRAIYLSLAELTGTSQAAAEA